MPRTNEVQKLAFMSKWLPFSAYTGVLDKQQLWKGMGWNSRTNTGYEKHNWISTTKIKNNRRATKAYC